MFAATDETHDPLLRSWVQSANGHAEFPIQNLPFGVFVPEGGTVARGGVAIGEHVLDLSLVCDARVLSTEAQYACATSSGATLNPLLALDSMSRVALRRGLSALLAAGAQQHPEWLHAAADCDMQLPVSVGDYTDFYAGIHHATNVGKLFRPDAPLLPNYKWVPIGYHGRASSVQVSGATVRRPCGQRRHASEDAPTYGPAQELDFELEMGTWVGAGNALGEAIPLSEAHEHIAGYCLLNDWSARDLQRWEYQPLGPFLAKSFHTTVSPWIVTSEALAPFRQCQAVRPAGDPQPLPYLLDENDQQQGALTVALEAYLLTAAMRKREIAPQKLSAVRALELYWTPQQLLTHHTSNGCNLRPGDLLGTGTISAQDEGGFGSLLEITQGGLKSLRLSSEEERVFLEDGDEVILRGTAMREGFVSIGFGECRAVVQSVTTAA